MNGIGGTNKAWKLGRSQEDESCHLSTIHERKQEWPNKFLVIIKEIFLGNYDVALCFAALVNHVNLEENDRFGHKN